MAEEQGRYGLELPDTDTISARFRYAVNYWQNRNKFIMQMRDMIGGNNKIEAPSSVHYKIKVVHSYILASLINEKTSRYLLRPTIQVVPDEELGDKGREKSSRIEMAIEACNYEIEQRSDADVWSRQIMDAILLDEGVAKVLRAPGTHWTDLVYHDQKAEQGGELKYPMDSEIRENYKKEMGVPLTRIYVPLEYFYPIYDGANLVECFEVSERSLISVYNNPLFQTEEGREALSTLGDLGADGGISKTVQIIEYSNNKHHAYYLAGPGPNSGPNAKWPTIRVDSSSYRGQLMKLYSYEHDLGRSIYNPVGGRYGGWKTNDNRIEGVGKGLLELSQTADEVLSQVLTNVRAKYWPSLNFQLDPEQRGIAPGEEREPPKINEGEAIVTYAGEAIVPIFTPEEDPMAMWVYNQIQNQVGKLGGSGVLFGEKQPGVDTGYQQALQQTSAESLDEKLHQNISKGAQQDATLILLHCKKIGEKVWMHYAETDKVTGKRRGKYISLDPRDLVPLPRMDAQVQKPSPMDFLSSLRAAREASDDRGGKGPLMSDDTIHEKILGTQHFDIEKKKILVESQKREVINSGVLSAKIGERINVKLAQDTAPDISPEMMQQVDPQLLAAIKGGGADAAASQGGIDPNILAGAAEQGGGAEGGGVGLPPGPVEGEPAPENRLGEAIQGNLRTGASI